MNRLTTIQLNDLIARMATDLYEAEDYKADTEEAMHDAVETQEELKLQVETQANFIDEQDRKIRELARENTRLSQSLDQIRLNIIEADLVRKNADLTNRLNTRKTANLELIKENEQLKKELGQ